MSFPACVTRVWRIASWNRQKTWRDPGRVPADATDRATPGERTGSQPAGSLLRRSSCRVSNPDDPFPRPGRVRITLRRRKVLRTVARSLSTRPAGAVVAHQAQRSERFCPLGDQREGFPMGRSIDERHSRQRLWTPTRSRAPRRRALMIVPQLKKHGMGSIYRCKPPETRTGGQAFVSRAMNEGGRLQAYRSALCTRPPWGDRLQVLRLHCSAAQDMSQGLLQYPGRIGRRRATAPGHKAVGTQQQSSLG